MKNEVIRIVPDNFPKLNHTSKMSRIDHCPDTNNRKLLDDSSKVQKHTIAIFLPLRAPSLFNLEPSFIFLRVRNATHVYRRYFISRPQLSPLVSQLLSYTRLHKITTE